LREHEAELQARGIAIVLISFANPKLARRWQEVTGFTYPLFLDPERKAYSAFGLGASVLAAWHPKMFLYYFRLLAQGRRLMPVRENPYQLGGDFLIDSQGVVLLAHPSVEPSDRLSITTLLGVV
jgi:hypothetical protein